MIMPAVFAFGLSPDAGPGLTFATMPAVFAQLPFGHFFAITFYVCLFVAALTSSISILEMSVQFLHDEFNISRPAGVTITGSILAVLGTLCALSFGTLSHVTIFGKSFFDFFDYLTSNIGMPIGVIGIAIVTAWLAWSNPMSENQTTTSWGSRLGFILASAGSAVGLGAIWKFPYMAGTNGGSVFMLPYIFFTFTVGISLLVAEFAMGRAGREGPMASLTKVCGRGWGFFGGVGVFTVFLILSFYSGVGGWCIKYMIDAVIGRGLISDPELLGTHFGAFVSDGSMSFLYMMIFLGITSVVVLRGIQGGIERVAKVLMPALFILMLIIIVRGLTLPGGLAGLEYLFAPRWEDFNASALFNAMGFCFFSLSLGAGTMITYGSYLSPKADLPGAVGWVAVLAIMSSILGGLMVLPAVFAFGLDPSAGPGLTFVTMPAVFSKMPLGQLFAVMFYVCLVVAALTSSVSMLEACTALLTRQFNMRRTPAILLTVASCTVVGLASTLSFGVWSDVKFFNRTIFDILDYVTSNVGMPLSTFGIAIAAAWVAWPTMKRELTAARPVSESDLWFIRIMIGVVSPLFVLVVAGGSL